MINWINQICEGKTNLRYQWSSALIHLARVDLLPRRYINSVVLTSLPAKDYESCGIPLLSFVSPFSYILLLRVPVISISLGFSCSVSDWNIVGAVGKGATGKAESRLSVSVDFVRAVLAAGALLYFAPDALDIDSCLRPKNVLEFLACSETE